MVTADGVVPYAIVMSGAFAVVFLGLLVKPYIKHIRDELPIPPIAGEHPESAAKWQQLIAKTDKSGHLIGILERLIFFGALLMPAKDAAPAIGVWLAFKVAAKWEAWNHMGYVPDKIKGVDPLDYAYARRIWAAHGYGTLVLGTGANFIIALVVAHAVRLGLAAIADPAWYDLAPG